MTGDLERNRLAIRQRPGGRPIMYQSWQKLLFIHWPLPPASLRPHIPQQLTIDTHDGLAWLAITPLHSQKRPPGLFPAHPGPE